MARLILFALALLAAVGPLKAADRPFCHADEVRAATLKAQPEVQQTVDSIEEAIRSYIAVEPQQRIASSSTSSAYIIPVVVYVVHGGGAENITDAQVQSQLSALNATFSGHGIRFCLATKNGNTTLPGATPGIIHVPDALTGHDTATEEAALKSVPPVLAGDRYLRIWVVGNIDNGSGVVGYARFPGTVPAALEGIVMRYDVFGDVAACSGCPLLPNYDRGQILAHEVGHYLNLFHTFQGGCTGLFTSDCATAGDRVCDTPQIATAGAGCPVAGSIVSCNGVPALTDNEMDYTNDLCRTSFTAGQETRMLATLATARQLLVSPQNLVHTGVQCTGGINASFAAGNYNPCTGQAVTFQAVSSSGATYAWDFGDGTTSSVQSPPPHSYVAPGAYNVTLTVTVGTNSISSTQQVFVSNCTPVTGSQANWYFGDEAALNFSTGVPVAVAGSAMSTSEGCVTQSNAVGALLFYSDSVTVYDKNHVVMNPTTPLNGNQSNSQSSISVPDPGNPNRYYLFTLGTSDSGGAALWYTIIDFTSSANGVLTSVNTPVTGSPQLAEQITAVPNCSNTGYWIIVHANFGNAFRVYSLTTSGISGPAMYPGVPGIYGTIKVSPDGRLLAQSTLASSGGPFASSAAVYNFDRATGAITLRNQIARGSYGAAFSPDSKLLYMAEYPFTFVAPPAPIYQYDLSDPNPDASVMLVALVASASPVNLQLGPDHKIYASGPYGGSNFLHVINYPNQRNTTASPNACGYSENGPSLGAGKVIWGLPNFIDARPPAQVPADFTFTVSSCSIVSFQTPSCAGSYAWDFGDGVTSTLQNPSHTYSPGSGTYTVQLTLNGSTVVTHPVTLGVAASATIFGPAAVCLTDPNVLVWNYSANAQPGLTYTWTATGGTISGPNGNSSVDVAWSALPGTLQLTITDPVSGCSITNSIAVTENCSMNQCVVPPAGLVDWWPFDETCGSFATDLAGFVNNVGFHVNGPVPVAGVVNGALSFDGVDDHVVVPDSPELNFYYGCILDFAEPMTIDAWIRTPVSSSSAGVLTILDKRVNPLQPTGFSLFLFNGRLGFQIHGVNYVAPSTGPDYVNLADNQWHFVAVSLGVCRGGSGFLYIDGKKVLVLPAGSGFETTAPLYIGARDPAFGPNFFRGAIDELEIFKTALTEDELRAIFEARGVGKCRPNCAGKTIVISPAAFQMNWTNKPAITASGGSAPYTFGVTAGSLPAGVTLSGTGTFSGPATQSGTYPFSVTALDADGCRAARHYELTVPRRRRVVR